MLITHERKEYVTFGSLAIGDTFETESGAIYIKTEVSYKAQANKDLINAVSLASGISWSFADSRKVKPIDCELIVKDGTKNEYQA